MGEIGISNIARQLDSRDRMPIQSSATIFQIHPARLQAVHCENTVGGKSASND